MLLALYFLESILLIIWYTWWMLSLTETTFGGDFSFSWPTKVTELYASFWGIVLRASSRVHDIVFILRLWDPHNLDSGRLRPLRSWYLWSVSGIQLDLEYLIVIITPPSTTQGGDCLLEAAWKGGWFLLWCNYTLDTDTAMHGPIPYLWGRMTVSLPLMQVTRDKWHCAQCEPNNVKAKKDFEWEKLLLARNSPWPTGTTNMTPMCIPAFPKQWTTCRSSTTFVVLADFGRWGPG